MFKVTSPQLEFFLSKIQLNYNIKSSLIA